MFLSYYFQKDGRPKDGYDLVDKPHAIFWLEEKLSGKKIENSEFTLNETLEAVKDYIISWFKL